MNARAKPRERPIPFSGRMVAAILAGTKTQTRRIVQWKPREPGLNLSFSGLDLGYYCTGVPSSGYVLRSRGGGGCWNDRTWPAHCPYGGPGDRLWVREAITRASSTPGNFEWGEFTDGVEACEGWRWKNDVLPSIFLPRELSRIDLEIVRVRMEKLQAITEEDARAVGLPHHDGSPFAAEPGRFPTTMVVHARDEFRHLWNSLNDDRAPWESNPYVWVVEFKRVRP